MVCWELIFLKRYIIFNIALACIVALNFQHLLSPQVLLKIHVSSTLLILICAGWAWFWIFVYGWSEYFEAGLIALSAIGCLQILTCLFCHWSVHIRCILTCKKVRCYTLIPVLELLHFGLACVASLMRFCANQHLWLFN